MKVLGQRWYCKLRMHWAVDHGVGWNRDNPRTFFCSGCGRKVRVAPTEWSPREKLATFICLAVAAWALVAGGLLLAFIAQGGALPGVTR